MFGGLTYNLKNPDTDYRNGVDLHIDWGAAQFLSKQFFVGAVGYFYEQLSADHGAPLFLRAIQSGETSAARADRGQKPQLVPGRSTGARVRGTPPGGAALRRVNRCTRRPATGTSNRASRSRCTPRRRPRTTVTSPTPTWCRSSLTEEQIEAWRRATRAAGSERGPGASSHNTGLPATMPACSRPLREMAGFFEETVRRFGERQDVSNWLMGEVLRLLNETGLEISTTIRSRLEALAELLEPRSRRGRSATTSGRKSSGDDVPAPERARPEIVKERGLEPVGTAVLWMRIVDAGDPRQPGPVADVPRREREGDRVLGRDK